MLVINKDNIDDLELELRSSLAQCWIQDFRDYDKLDNLQELINLKISGISVQCDELINQIDDLETKLNKETEDKKFFEENNKAIYHDVIELEKSFLKICHRQIALLYRR